MSIFSPIEKGLKGIEELELLIMSSGATIVECADPQDFIARLEEFAPKGRCIFHWDVRTFRKNDAIGSMYTLFQLPKGNKPIVIIENITDIPDGDRSVYDDPVIVENVLLHSWKDDTIHLTHPTRGSFELQRLDYTVLFPVYPGSLENLNHSIKGEMAFLTQSL